MASTSHGQQSHESNPPDLPWHFVWTSRVTAHLQPHPYFGSRVAKRKEPGFDVSEIREWIPIFFLPNVWSWASSFNIQVPSCLIYYLYFMMMVKNKWDNVWGIFSTCLAHSGCPRNSSYYILTQLWEQDSCFILLIPLPHPISYEPAMCLLVLETCSVNICWKINTWINEWIWKLPAMPRKIHLSQ